jgi:hydroxypyruvate isomerase
VVGQQRILHGFTPLLHVLTGDVTKGELGFAAIPGAEEKFSDSINLAVKYAKALQCTRYVLCALSIIDR